MTGSKSSKRLDLQGIRGLAILAVLGFHFYPHRFPNGYLGVDQFFVLSGFLMCMLLKRSENEAPCTLISLFYSKRFKRILPLYLILIFISMIALYLFFPKSAIETNQESAMEALLFISNRPRTQEENYFQQLSSAINIFTHTWSLSVEIQFYFLVPFLFLLGTRFSDQKFQYAYYSIISLISFIFFFMSPDTVAFNSVFARIWQFLIGMMIYMTGNEASNKYQKLENQEVDEEMGKDRGNEVEPSETVVSWKFQNKNQYQNRISYVLLLLVCLINTYPVALTPQIVRPLVTVGTGFLMLVSKENIVLSNRLLTYIGDISYSLYLIHWPIYAYWKSTCDGDQKLLLLALISSIILAIICFETYEKWYLTLSSENIAALCILLFSLNLLAIHSDKIVDLTGDAERNMTLSGVLDNMTVDDAIKMNQFWNDNDPHKLYAETCKYELQGPFNYCRHKGLSPSGKYKMAIIGNSMAANQATMFYQECGYKAKSILQGAPVACEPLYPTNGYDCKPVFETFEWRIRLEQPDYAFIITRYITIGDPFPPNVTTFDKDPIYQTMKTQMLKFISNIKYKLFIVDAIPSIKQGGVVKDIAPLVKNGTDPEVIDDYWLYPHYYKMARRRHAQLIKDCNGKCELIDYTPEFYNHATGKFRYFDKRGFVYLTQSEHWSPLGLEHIRHFWTDVCRKL